MEPILIHKGDCTIFATCPKFLTFVLDTELDLTGWTAEFSLFSITRTIPNIVTKSFEVALSHNETSKLLCGEAFGSIKLIDSKGNIKTICNTIPFKITSEVIENRPQTIDLSIPESSGVDILLKVGLEPVISVNGKIGEVVLTAGDVGALPDTTVIPDISNLATKDEIPDVSNFITEAELPDTSNFVTKNEIPNVSNFVTKDELPTISEVPTKLSQLDNDMGYITQTELDNQLGNIEALLSEV